MEHEKESSSVNPMGLAGKVLEIDLQSPGIHEPISRELDPQLQGIAGASQRRTKREKKWQVDKSTDRQKGAEKLEQEQTASELAQAMRNAKNVCGDSKSLIGERLPTNASVKGVNESNDAKGETKAVTSESEILNALFRDEMFMRGLQAITGLRVCPNPKLRYYCLQWFRHIRHVQGKPITDINDAKQHLSYLLRPDRKTRADFHRYHNEELAKLAGQ